MSEFKTRPATRQGVRPLIGLYSESGCGKTMSALLLARGLVGPKGKIVMIDSESGRGELYADVIQGGYDVIPLAAPFTPARYIAAICAAEESGAGIIVIDSMTHEWAGIGGVLDMASQNEERTGKPGLHCWKTPKLEHSKMMAKLLQCKTPVVACIRAKYKSRQVKENGRTAIIKDEHTSPEQAEDFIYEMTAHAEIMPDHSIHLTKCSHPSLRNCFPEKGPITSKHGEMVAEWCNAAPMAKPTNQAVDKSSRKKLMGELMTATANVHHCPKDGDMLQKQQAVKAVEQWLWDEGKMNADTETLDGISDDRLAEIIKAVAQ